ncbi:MAG: transposase [Pseudomonadota bacterium]|nr:transposase [Pseudomonadota bacterium]
MVLFAYQADRRHAHPERFLQGNWGAIMTDGYATSRMLRGIRHSGCMAHAKRRFDGALKA